MPKEAPTYTYAQWQLQEVRKQLRNGGETVMERAAKMSNLDLAVVQLIVENDGVCQSILRGEKIPEKTTEVREHPKPPGGNA